MQACASLPHLQRDWARLPTSSPGLGSPLLRLTQDSSLSSHTCDGTWLTPATSAPALGSPLLHPRRADVCDVEQDGATLQQLAGSRRLPTARMSRSWRASPIRSASSLREGFIKMATVALPCRPSASSRHARELPKARPARRRRARRVRSSQSTNAKVVNNGHGWGTHWHKQRSFARARNKHRDLLFRISGPHIKMEPAHDNVEPLSFRRPGARGARCDGGWLRAGAGAG